MGKTSPSLKKKRSRNSSHQGRKRKRNKSRSRRDKSKKLKRRSDSISYPDDDNSRSLVSVSSFSSEDDYRSRKSRSRTRKDVKGNKKKAQRRSYSSESLPPVKKRKGSKRNEDDAEVRKKSHKKKKKPRRDASISSESSWSRSCSTCRGGSDSSYESEFERHRDHRSERKGKGKMEKVRSGTCRVGSSSSDESEYEWPRRSEKRDRDRRSSEKVKSRIKRGRYRSRSSSSLKGCSENSGYQSEEQLMGEHNTRRLRSVIIATKEVTEERNFDMDEHKEEILYDHDDYPSCRSNDSNDGGNKRESSHQSHFAFDKKGLVENEKEEEAVVSYMGNAELIESGKDGEGQYDGSDTRLNGVGMSDSVNENKSEVSGAVGSLNGDDLESILRKTALENLNRFRGGRKTDAKACANLKDKDESDLKQPSSAETDSVQIKPSNGDSAGVLGAAPIVDKISKPLVRRDSTRTFRNVWKLSDGNGSGNASRDAKQDVTCQPDRVAITGNPKENANATVDPDSNKSKFATTVLMRKSSKTNTAPKQPALQEPRQAKLVTKSGVDAIAAETAQLVTQRGSNNGDEVDNNACASAAPEPSPLLKSTSGEISSNKKQDNTESSQLEEKTMSVMRGGEMVQVSYKVYIPKKTPALARRKIQR